MSDAAAMLSGHAAATVFEAAMLPCSLDPSIKPLDDTWTICGPARTVATAPGHNLWLHRAIYDAAPGDVLVVDTGGDGRFGYWGEIMSTAASHRRLGGLVITGSVRDAQQLRAIGFPVFSSGLFVRGTGKSAAGGGIGRPVTISGVEISSGD